MNGIDPQDIEAFRRAYDCILSESHRVYSKPMILPLGTYDPNAAFQDTIQVQTSTGIDVTFMQEKLHELVRDAEEGRTARETRNWHPAVREAWEQYQVLLELARRSPR